MNEWDVLLRLAVAVVLGGAIGFERESHQHPAGLRTHMLVALGAALWMILSISVSRPFMGMTSADPGRIAAQVVSGIGFLGAGTIMREGLTIRGLTTAASLWVSAAVGLGAGNGDYEAAIATTVLALVTLVYLSKIELRFLGRSSVRVRVVVNDRPGELGAVAALLGRHRLNIRNVSMEPTGTPDELEITFTLAAPREHDLAPALSELLRVDGVRRVERVG